MCSSADPHSTAHLRSDHTMVLSQEDHTKPSLLVFCVCASACKEPGGRGQHLQAVRGAPVTGI